MAVNPEFATKSGGFSLSSPGMGTKILLGVAVSAVIAVMAVVFLWSQKTEYKVLFSGFNDKDGGAIVAALEQQGVPYKYTDGGSAIMVPSEHVHNLRLKLAAQGLPKGSNVGFEVLEQQKFGVSQFVEQVNYTRALEGELERTVQTIGAVQSARVHLAIPKSTTFVRDQKKPSASVMLNLHPGRTLDKKQVSAIVHLVSSSIQELPVSGVTIVDQEGNLLTNTEETEDGSQVNPEHIKYVNDLQMKVVKRVENIITPLVGAENVRAEATADVDFSSVEQADEKYTPNQTPDASTIRSQQSMESTNMSNGLAIGIPGAVSNQPQPPADSSAPIDEASQNLGGMQQVPSSSQKNTTTNYEVDKTVKYTQQAMGGIRRLTVAVVVNNKTEVGKDGKTISRPLTDAEKARISDLAKQAMGFNEARGDTLTVVNDSFVSTEAPVVNVPFWKTPQFMDMAVQLAKLLGALIVIAILYRKILKPILNKVAPPEIKVIQAKESEVLAAPKDGDDAVVVLSSEAQEELKSLPYKTNLDSARKLSMENPKLVAAVISGWVGSEK